MSRDLLANHALAHIPKLLTLLDRNPHSPTYGCFDRNYWHYKIIDFPSGMAQEFVWPLALAYDTELPGNSFYRQPMLPQWVEAGILYAARSAHKDGSCDDYFPFERASGAAAFSLLACVESYTLLQLKHQEALVFFEQRANWLARHHESGRLTNHQALIALVLELLSHLLQTHQWDRAKSLRLERVLDWQNPEGWFQEYEGCDPGYHTLTISCLARIYQLRPDPRLKEAIARAIKLASYFMHPDGSYGGEYTSRNTYNFFPHGFELVGHWLPEALQINDRFLMGLANGLAPCYADDHIIGHHTWNYLLAWRDFVVDRPDSAVCQPEDAAGQTQRLWLQQGQILIDRRQNTHLYLSLNKGGAFKFFRHHRLITADTQFSLQVQQGRKLKNAVGHLIGPYQVEVDTNEIVIRGQLGWAKQKQMTPLNLLILRIVMLTLGRFFPNLIRRLLQKLLIVGKQDAPFHFTRRFRWQNGHWQLKDELWADSWQPVVTAGLGCDQTSIYVVMSRTFQPGQLQPWVDLTPVVKNLAPGQPLELERQL
ncbi:MAG: hypothetical protein F6K19_26805 [Cyanothece sp. SIO1E1]|nr:hypothetical protein [Cyanothece sp. SIO1E1]